MNYGKSGNAKPPKRVPRFDKHKDEKQGKDARGGKASKEELLARMKAAQKKD